MILGVIMGVLIIKVREVSLFLSGLLLNKSLVPATYK